MNVLATITISIARQTLTLARDGKALRSWPVSTSRYGAGCQSGSNKTPTGAHRIVSKIGRNVPMGGVLCKRHYTGKIAAIFQRPRAGRVDQITTRILRLEGLEEGINRGGDVDTFRRCVYIHGTPEEWLIGTPVSHGCIRMRNRDVVELFELARRGMRVSIE